MTKQFSVTRTIEATPETVWDLLTDAESYGDWNEAVISIEGPIELGKTIKLVSVVDPERTFKLKVSKIQAPHLMTWSDGMPLGLFKGERTYNVTPEGGASVFSMTEQFSGPLAPLITKAIPDMTESFNTFADGLKAAAERSPA